MQIEVQKSYFAPGNIDKYFVQVMDNGNLILPPFRASDYKQEVHAQVSLLLLIVVVIVVFLSSSPSSDVPLYCGE